MVTGKTAACVLNTLPLFSVAETQDDGSLEPSSDFEDEYELGCLGRWHVTYWEDVPDNEIWVLGGDDDSDKAIVRITSSGTYVCQ